MPDLQDYAFRTALASDYVQVYPGVLVQIYKSSDNSLVSEDVADADGLFSVTSLPTGQYYIKIDGRIVREFHHVKADHVHQDETWILSKFGEITASEDETENKQIFYSDVAGKIVKVKIIVQVTDATGDGVVHLLKGDTNTSGALTVGSDSVWQHQVNPGNVWNRYRHVDNAPAISLAANEAVTFGLVHTATTWKGLTILITFRPD